MRSILTTLERNYPYLALLLKQEEKNTDELFHQLDLLLATNTIEEFKKQCDYLSLKYPLFKQHMDAKVQDKPFEEIYERFLNHRELAADLFEMIKYGINKKDNSKIENTINQ